jgi:MFS family permease
LGGFAVRLFRHLPPRARHAFLHDLVGAVLFGTFAGVVIPFAAVVARRLGAPPLWISVLTSASALGFFLTAGWAPTLVASNPVALVVWPAALARGLFLLSPWLAGAEALVALVVGYHLLNGLTVPAYAETVDRVLPPELRGRLVGTVRVGMSVAAAGASLLAGPAIQRYGHGPVFAVASVFGVAGALVFGRIRLPRGSLRRTVTPPAWWTALQDRNFRTLLLATFVFGFGGWMMAPAVPLLLVDELRTTSPQVGVLSAASSLASMVGFFVWGRYVDRRSGVAALRTLLTAAIATPLLFLVSFHPWFALLPFTSDGFFLAGLDLAWMAACMELAPPGRVAAYAAAYTVLMGFRGITAPFLAGALASAVGPRPVFLLASLLIGLAGFLARRHLRAPTQGALPR